MHLCYFVADLAIACVVCWGNVSCLAEGITVAMADWITNWLLTAFVSVPCSQFLTARPTGG